VKIKKRSSINVTGTDEVRGAQWPQKKANDQATGEMGEKKRRQPSAVGVGQRQMAEEGS